MPRVGASFGLTMVLFRGIMSRSMQTKHVFKFAVVVLILLGIASTSSKGEGGMRTWTAKNGQTLEAEFVKFKYGTVYLKKADGKMTTISLAVLSEEDKKFVKENSAQEETKAADKSSDWGNKPKSKGSGTLSDKEIGELQTQWRDDKTGANMVFRGSFGGGRVSSKDKAKYVKSGKIPVRITATLYEVKTDSSGKQKASLKTSGTAYFYVLDDKDEVVFKKSASMAKMCPS